MGAHDYGDRTVFTHGDAETNPFTFTLNIELGNAAMQWPRELAAAVEFVAEQIRDGVIAFPVMDENGNKVGSWELPNGYPPERCEGCGRPEDDADAPGEPCSVCGAGYDD
jgi:hypothetical protein